MKRTLVAVILTVALTVAILPAGIQAQSFSDLGHALNARGYSGTVWVNSFDTSQPYLAHGVFYPDTPITPNGSYETRYGMQVTGSGTVFTDSNGFWAASGTAHNPNNITSDGSILVELFHNGNLADSAKVLFICAPLSDCNWSTHFITRSDHSSGWTVTVRRHVEGARSGGERNIDLNGPCHKALVDFFLLPASYVFTNTDLIDTNYVSKPGDSDSVLGTLLIPLLCIGGSNQVAPLSSFVANPSDVYPGTVVSFVDTSANLPTSWAWTFQGGSPSTSAGSNPQVQFSSVGAKTVTLVASNSAGPGNLFTKVITVLDPTPRGSVTASAGSITQCQSVDFNATITGGPPLSYVWEVLDSRGTTLNPPGRVPFGSSFSWASQPGNQPGTYTAKVTVSNSTSPNGVAFTTPVQLIALPALTDISGAAPTTNNFQSNLVQFTAPAFTGATKVVWDYGDGKTDTFTDPVAGSAPSHSYAPGDYNAKVTISNCVNSVGSASQTVPVHVTQSTQIVASFQANDTTCQFGTCTFTVGQPAAFVDSSIGADFWDYDWTHASAPAESCNFTDNGHTSPVTSHTFTATGTFYPCLRVRRATGEQNVTVHPAVKVNDGQQQTPAIALSGPATGLTGQSYTFTGAASNCTPSDSGWTWNVSGGTISGSTTGNGISVKWTAAGSKTVTATNSACAGAQGTKTIVISDPVPPQAQFTFSPTSPKTAEVVSFDATSSINIASGSAYGWDFGDGTSASGPVALHAYDNANNYNVRLTITPPGCLTSGCQLQTAKTVGVVQPGGPQFTVAPASPGAGEEVTFDSSPSTQIVAGSNFAWDFGDGSVHAVGPVVTHVFAQPGTYQVLLAVAPPGCVSLSCLALAPKHVTVGPRPPVLAEFTADVTCPTQAGTGSCQAKTGKTVTLTATDDSASTYAWSFGDGKTGSGRTVYHAWAAPGSYTVALTVTQGTASAVKTRTFDVTGPPPPKNKTVLLPVAFQSRGPLVQSNDLYIYNPAAASLDVTVEFRRQGAGADDLPLRVPVTLGPGAMLFAPDVLSGVFGLENVAGYITVTANSETVEPVVTEFDSSGQTTAKVFGGALPGSSFGAGSLGAADSANPAQHLVGLSDTADRQASFGIANPSDEPATYRLRLFDKSGNLLGVSATQDLDRQNQRQFQTQEIRELFSISNVQDYRVEVESVSGPQVFPVGSDVRLATGDPSFVPPGSYTAPTAYLLGVVNGAGTAGSKWQTDLLLSNVGDQPAQASVRLTKVGTKPGQAVSISVPAGVTLRQENVLLSKFSLKSGIGMLTVSSTSPNGVYPIVKAESFDNTNPQKRFGQGIVALTDADAADTSHKLVLVGLRQDGLNKTTLWLFNPSGVAGLYDLVYRDINGNVLGTLQNVKAPAGQLVQIGPTQHPIRKPGTPYGVSVEVVVKSGKALAAAQVVRNGSNDPAYVPAVVR
ncbi:MAG TPA: PKD domain-containing protein [Thermoanaerobaculia bacterium]|nr:PKD domain-containing protein [Thermoanaerobaculia bacterium]